MDLLCDVPLVAPVWSQALTERLQLRKVRFLRVAFARLCTHNIHDQTLLELMDRRDDVFKDQIGFKRILDSCQHLFQQMRSRPPPHDPPIVSAATKAFDPYISRRLNTFLPIRVIELPNPSQSWDNWMNFIEGCGDYLALSQTQEVASWEVFFFCLSSQLCAENHSSWYPACLQSESVAPVTAPAAWLC